MNKKEDLRLLTMDEIESRLAVMPGWVYRDGKIARDFTFVDFLSAFDFVAKVMTELEKMNHHPDIFLSGGRVGFELSTHSRQAVTELDFQAAEIIDRKYGYHMGKSSLFV